MKILSCKRAGKDTSERVRPVKFTFSSSDQARTILSKTKLLRHVEGFSSVYNTLDRSAADRIAYKKVVDQLLNKRTAEPDKVHCSTFGLVNKWGKFLSAQRDDTVDWDRSNYGSLEVIRFVQNGKDTGSLKSSWNKYLSASTKHHLVWDRSAAYSLERFKVHQYEDKVAFQSYHGRYLSAQKDGTVDVDRTNANSWEWFTVHPQDCLNNIECDCSRTINRDDYEFKSVTYDTTGGHVKAFAPDRVGYQHIDNRDGSVTQSSTFTVSESVQETATFTHTAGASVTLGTEFSVGIPFVGEGKVTASITASYSFSAGNSRSETKTKTATFNCVASAGKSVTCEALLFKYRATIPYTQTWQHKRLPCTCTSTGQFSEISADEMRMTITED
ncbi:uncharacterized protein LOC134814060 [Bolinopsis microptera]|uniref:uncharacterized protein LOC134814060 n=1 Tax=Bolinopsis microptera TaxID=2820187 RepID=UPI003079A4BC